MSYENELATAVGPLASPLFTVLVFYLFFVPVGLCQVQPPFGDTLPVSYYVDSLYGSDTRDGLTPETAWKTWRNFGAKATPGCSLLLKRDCFFQLPLPLVGGAPNHPITYAAYGSGAAPILEGSLVNLSTPGVWIEVSRGVWRTQSDQPEAANLIFNDTVCGNMRRSVEDLHDDGEWFQSADGTGPLWVHSAANPSQIWPKIEMVRPGAGVTLHGSQASHVRLENLLFRKIGGHGIQISNASDVVIRNCDLTLIGGQVFRYDDFSRKYGEQFVKRRVRYGNGIETWETVSDIAVEGCRLWEIYDAGVDVQGFSGTATNVTIKNNVLWNVGYDCLDVAHGILCQNVVYDHNTTANAGTGWALQGEGRPRYSVNYPDTVGFNCNLESSFGWNDQCKITITNNIFFNAPGARCFNFGPDKPSPLIKIDHNCYFQPVATDEIVRIGKKKFLTTDFKSYQGFSGWDATSIIADPHFVDVPGANFNLQNGSLATGMGSTERLLPDKN